jgi:hypothetical protein
MMMVEMSRHPEDERRYNEATRSVKYHTNRIKEQIFQTWLRSSATTDDTLENNQKIKTTDTMHPTHQRS